MTLQETQKFQGTRIGRYEVIRRIAIGGMAEIFLATDTAVKSVKRTVVLKCILPNISRDPSFVELFLDEIRVAARLSHQNIAHVYDFGEDNGLYFIAMEYIDGVHVSQLVRGMYPELIPIEHALKVASLVAEALFHAHNLKGEDGTHLGIIHRDVSPENVMISQDGQVKLVDFGVARAADQVHQTQVGILRGKAAYLSPEQCMGMPFDHRVDIFSLGIVLHEMLCGRRLFKRENDFRTMQAVCSDTINAPGETRPDVSRRLDEIVMRALARDPVDRYQQADELSVDLEQVLHEEHLLSNQIMLGRFVRTVLERGDAMRESISGEGQPTRPGEGSGSHSGVRITTEENVGRPQTGVTVEARIGRDRRERSQPLEIALSLDLEEALSELSGEEIDASTYFSDTQDIPVPDMDESPRRKSHSLELDLDEALITGDSALSSALMDVDSGESTFNDLPSGLARALTKVEGKQPPQVEVIRAPTEPPGARRDRDEPPWTVEIDRRDVLKSHEGATPQQPVKVVPPVHLGQPETGEMVVEPSQGNAQSESPAIEGAPVVVVSSDSSEHPLSGVPLIDLSTYVEPSGDDEFDEEAQTIVWQQNHFLQGDNGPQSVQGGLVSSLPTQLLSAHPGRSRRNMVLVFVALVFVTALTTTVILWPRGEQQTQESGRVEATPSTKEGSAPRPVPSPIPAEELRDQERQTPTPAPTEPGELVLRVNNVDTVIIDDLLLTPAEARRGVSLNPGEHTVRVIRPRHRFWARRIKVAPGTRLQLTARPRRASRRWGMLSIESDEGCEVYIADTFHGRTPISDLVLWPGPHDVKLVADDGKEARQMVTIPRGKASDLFLEKGAFSDRPRAVKNSKSASRQKVQLSQRGKLPVAAAMSRARTCFENADFECCVRSLEGFEDSSNAINLMVTCLDVGGHLDDACTVARRNRKNRSCAQFVSRRCREREM